MALNRRDRDERAAAVRRSLRYAWTSRSAVRLTLQDGRRRPVVTGRVVFVATSGAYALIRDDGQADESIGERPGPLHVPVESIRELAVPRREGWRRVVPNQTPVPEARSTR